MSQAVQTPHDLMTVAEFLEWEPGDGRMWQLVDGVPTAMAPPSGRDGAIQSETARLIGNHLLAQGSPCRVVVTPGVVTPMAADNSMRIPDLAVTYAPVADDAAVPVADPVLIVEVLSPGNQRETWINVWTYTLVPSVQEVLVLHSAAIRADILRRGPDGTWPTATVPVTPGNLALDSIGLGVPLADLYRTTALAQ